MTSPAQWKGNKRIHLPKGGSTSLEAYLEIRRQEASRTFDNCMELLSEGCKKSHENIDIEEKQGLKSLQERVEKGELIVAQTDKSGKFAVLTREQYIEAATAHIKNDREIDLEESKKIENHLNGHMRWWAEMTGLSDNWNQRDRAVRNILNHGLAVCPLTLLIKDHKIWSVDSGDLPPSRPVVGGNVGGNRPLSEFTSLVLEPVAKRMLGMEINATGGLLNLIETVNKDLENTKKRESSQVEETVKETSSQVEEAQDLTNHQNVISEGWKLGGGDSVNTLTGSVSVADSQSNTVSTVTSEGWKVDEQEYETDEEEFMEMEKEEELSTPSIPQEEIPNHEQLYISRDKNGQATIHLKQREEPTGRDARTNLLRNKMTLVRKNKEISEKRIKERLDKKGKLRAKTYKLLVKSEVRWSYRPEGHLRCCQDCHEHLGHRVDGEDD